MTKDEKIAQVVQAREVYRASDECKLQRFGVLHARYMQLRHELADIPYSEDADIFYSEDGK